MTKREWKTKALGYILFAKENLNSQRRHDREYAKYLKRFFFGDGEIVFNGENEVWQKRKENMELPMPRNIYLMVKEVKIMWRYEVLYRENGVLKNKGFGYRDQFDRFLKKLVKKSQSKKAQIEIIEIADNENGIRF